MTMAFVNPTEPNFAVLKPDTKAAGYSIWFPLLFVVGGLGIVVRAIVRRARDRRDFRRHQGARQGAHIPILFLAQLNRGPEGRTGKSLGITRMSDLRESGGIEQDADLVGLLYRSKYYAENDEERAALEGKAELVFAKNRNG